ncbi:MAG TPA: M81 family metallopeptidase [Clostridiaceae bacterium]|nr:M81 family metallopeptidase [Clostridiaceae bacterium]
MLDRIPSCQKIDGIWLYLHGAMEVEEIGSGEVALLSAIRKKVGYDIPISVALDFHANNSTELTKYANIICGYKTAPHTDMEETQIKTAQLLLKCIREKLLPKPVIIQIPLMITGDMVITSSEPMKTIIDETEKIERQPGILSASVFNGQNWVDAPNAGASVIVVPEKEEYTELAHNEARKLAKMFWDAREKFKFQVDAFEPEEAVEAAISAEEKLVFITDSGDNTTAGAAGDNAYLLKIILKKNVGHTLIGGITDSRAVKICESKRIGDRVELILGGELDVENSESVRITGIIKNKGNILGWYGEDGGKAVVLNIEGKSIDIIVTERRCALISPEIFESIGVNIYDYEIVVVKLGYLYPKLAQVAKKAIFALTPGASCEAIEKLKFYNIGRKVYPINKDIIFFDENKNVPLANKNTI